MDPRAEIINSDEFRRVCARYPTGITVTTCRSSSGEPVGITINSFTSVSLKPPLILVCIDYRSQMLRHLVLGKCFGVNCLGDRQLEVSLRFSRKWEERFDNVSWCEGETGVPLLNGVTASLECRVTDMRPAGDHVIVLGEVLFAKESELAPLVYLNRSYVRVTVEDAAS